MSFIANFISILSLLCGFAAIAFSIDNSLIIASWAILFSVVLDGIDGQLARRIPQEASEFGKELDSLVDVISFGIAPVILAYSFIYQRSFPYATVILFIYLLCAVLRLAKYNITPREEMRNFFFGLPTTVSGGVMASFALICKQNRVIVFTGNLLTLFLLLTLLLSLLMISRLHYPNLDGLIKFVGKKAKFLILAFVLLLVVAMYLKVAGVFLFGAFLIYLIFSPFVVKD